MNGLDEIAIRFAKRVIIILGIIVLAIAIVVAIGRYLL